MSKKKLLMVSLLICLLVSVLMLSFPAFAQEETQAVETTSDDDAYGVTDASTGNSGSNVGVFIGVGVAIFAGVFVVISGSRQKEKSNE